MEERLELIDCMWMQGLIGCVKWTESHEEMEVQVVRQFGKHCKPICWCTTWGQHENLEYGTYLGRMAKDCRSKGIRVSIKVQIRKTLGH